MVKAIAVIVAVLYSPFSFSQTTKKKTEAQNCKNEWRYLALSDTLLATVLFDQKATFFCGVVSSTSTTLVRKSNGDTIRVLQMCNVGNPNMKKGRLVRIVPGTVPHFRVDMIPDDPKAGPLKDAYFGLIEQ